MSTNDKLSTLTSRMDELRREISGLEQARPHSTNAALAELEDALMTELHRIEAQVHQLQTFIDKCASNPDPSESRRS